MECFFSIIGEYMFRCRLSQTNNIAIDRNRANFKKKNLVTHFRMFWNMESSAPASVSESSLSAILHEKKTD